MQMSTNEIVHSESVKNSSEYWDWVNGASLMALLFSHPLTVITGCLSVGGC